MIVITTKRFDKQFKKLSPRIQNEFAKRISLFLLDRNNPLLNTHKLTGRLKDLHSFNLSGDIRVLCDLSVDDKVLLIAIGSHSELYG